MTSKFHKTNPTIQIYEGSKKRLGASLKNLLLTALKMLLLDFFFNTLIIQETLIIKSSAKHIAQTLKIIIVIIIF